MSDEDVRQGYVGNCYYVSVTSAIAAHDNRLKSIVLTDEPNKSKVFVMNVVSVGVNMLCIIDDTIPMRGKNAFIFTQRARSGALWPQLTEKCWSKFAGHYEATEGGWMSEAMTFLTGMPTIDYRSTG